MSVSYEWDPAKASANFHKHGVSTTKSSTGSVTKSTVQDQSLIDEVLRQHIRRSREPLEETLRRVIREEIRRAS